MSNVIDEEEKLQLTRNPTTKMLMDFLGTISYRADHHGYMREVINRVLAYKDIELLRTAYKKALEKKSGQKEG